MTLLQILLKELFKCKTKECFEKYLTDPRIKELNTKQEKEYYKEFERRADQYNLFFIPPNNNKIDPDLYDDEITELPELDDNDILANTDTDTLRTHRP